jgi:hypothetical protein
MGGEIISESGGGIIPLQGGAIIPELGGGFLREFSIPQPARACSRRLTRLQRHDGHLRSTTPNSLISASATASAKAILSRPRLRMTTKPIWTESEWRADRRLSA